MDSPVSYRKVHDDQKGRSGQEVVEEVPQTRSTWSFQAHRVFRNFWVREPSLVCKAGSPSISNHLDRVRSSRKSNDNGECTSCTQNRSATVFIDYALSVLHARVMQ